jgi:hypothetical protein
LTRVAAGFRRPLMMPRLEAASDARTPAKVGQSRLRELSSARHETNTVGICAMHGITFRVARVVGAVKDTQVPVATVVVAGWR